MEKKVLESLQRRCARAEYCSSDIYRKALKAMDGDAEAAARITASLVKDRFVDDLRYASAFAREKASLQGWGAVKIRFMLRGKGIDEATVGQALGEIDPAKASAKLEKVVREKNRTLAETQAEQIRPGQGILLRRGGEGSPDIGRIIIICIP